MAGRTRNDGSVQGAVASGSDSIAHHNDLVPHGTATEVAEALRLAYAWATSTRRPTLAAAIRDAWVDLATREAA